MIGLEMGDCRDSGGVVVCGSPADGLGSSKLELSVQCSDRLFGAIHARARDGSFPMPAVVQAWADMSGWWEAEEPTPLNAEDVNEMADSLSALLSDCPDNGRSLAMRLNDAGVSTGAG
jgi:hypothetical protein